MSVRSLLKQKQNRLLSKTWRAVVTAREIEMNHFQLMHDVRKARDFAFTAVQYTLEPIMPDEEKQEPKLIFSAV